MQHSLEELAAALRERNRIDSLIARIIGRPAEKGHVGEFIAARIFGIDLAASAANKGSDGRFVNGPLCGRSVNVKFYGEQEGKLNINPDVLPDFFLVLAGPRSNAASSRGRQCPLVIESVHLFHAERLVAALRERGVKIGVPTSVATKFWEDAEVHPRPQHETLRLTDEQGALLAAFSTRAIGPEQTE